MTGHVVRFVLLSLFAGTALVAQTIPFGSIVVFTSPSGLHLSAVPAEVLALSPNTNGWEQWEYQNNALNSFHGTTVMMTYSGGTRVFHGPSSGDGILVGGLDAKGHFGAPVVNGGAVAIHSVNLHTYVVQETNGVITVSGLQDPNFVPPAARWTVSVVPAAAGGRQHRMKNAIKGFYGSIMSSHGSYLAIKGTEVTHQAQKPGPVEVRTELNATSERPVWHFGQSIYIFMKSQFGYETMQPGGPPDHGMETVVFKPMADRIGWSEKWTLVPLGYYKDGDRVPEGEPLLLRSAKGTYVSADPGLPKLRLTTSTGAWEHWSFFTSNWKN